MEGEETLSDDPRSYHSASAWKRFFILISGAAMNFLLGLVILICLCASSYHASTVIASFAEGCPAAEYLQVGDQILSIDGKTVFISGDITTLLGRGNGETVDFVVRRNGEIVTLKEVPSFLAAYSAVGATSVRD